MAPVHSPVPASHTRTVLSYDPAATWDPSGLQATELTSLECPTMVKEHFPVPASHTRTVLSHDPDATWDPSELQATEYAEEECPSRVHMLSPVPASINFEARSFVIQTF